MANPLGVNMANPLDVNMANPLGVNMTNPLHFQFMLVTLEETGDIVKRLEAAGFLLFLHSLEQMERDTEWMIDTFHENDHYLDSLNELGLSGVVYTLVHSWMLLRELGPRRIRHTLRRLLTALAELWWEPDWSSALEAARQTQRRLRRVNPAHTLGRIRGLGDLLRDSTPSRGFRSTANRPDVVAALGRANVFLLLARTEGLVQHVVAHGCMEELEVLKALSETLLPLLA